MEFFGIRQYEYLLRANQGIAFSGLGLYRIAIFIIIICLSIIQLTSYDSDSIIFSTSFALGLSFLSFLGGRFLTTMLPFLVSEIFMSRTKINKNIYLFIRVLILAIFVYGWLII